MSYYWSCTLGLQKNYSVFNLVCLHKRDPMVSSTMNLQHGISLQLLFAKREVFSPTITLERHGLLEKEKLNLTKEAHLPKLRTLETSPNNLINFHMDMWSYTALEQVMFGSVFDHKIIMLLISKNPCWKTNLQGLLFTIFYSRFCNPIEIEKNSNSI